MAKLIKNVQLKKGMVLALPFGKTATIQSEPRVGTKFVSFTTEFGPTRVEKNEYTLIAIEED